MRVWRTTVGGAGPRLPGESVPPPVGLPAGTVSSLCFSPDGRRLTCVSRGRTDGDHRVSLLDLPSFQVRELPARLHHFVRGLAFSPGGRHLAFVGGKQQIELWDVLDAARDRPAASFGSEELVSGYGGIALSQDGAWFACGNQVVAIWDVASHKKVLALPQEHSTVWARAWSPNRELLAVSSSDGGPVIWDLRQVRSRLSELGLDW